MTHRIPSPVPMRDDVRVHPGPALLADLGSGPSLAAHRRLFGELPGLDLATLTDVVKGVGLRGRGGAAFPFAIKLSTAAEGKRRPVVVVNLSEGEPASGKDSALAQTRPHLILDGAVATAVALRARDVYVVLPGDRPLAAQRMTQAMAERSDPVRLHRATADARFVAGQASAVVQLLSGRPNLPATTWVPDAVSGLDGRPTLLSNAETFAHVAAVAALGPGTFARAGTVHEPGTTLLTVAGDGPGGVVVEVPIGEPLAVVMHRCGYDPDMPALVGGYHGTWLPAQEVARRRLSREDLATVGATLGCGAVLPLGATSCPVQLTAQIVEYLAGVNARRCGPCMNGLPELARAVTSLASGGGMPASARITTVTGLVRDRGACAHPDGTVRLVQSLMTAFPTEVAAHERGGCAVG